MGVISTPPIPAAANASSCRVMPARSTALPGHHQRVHGLAVGVTSGQGVDAGGAAYAGRPASKASAQTSPLIATPSARVSARNDLHAIAFRIADHAFVVAVARATRTIVDRHAGVAQLRGERIDARLARNGDRHVREAEL